MKIVVNDLLRVRRVAPATNGTGKVYVTFVEGSSEYQSPLQVEFDANPGLVEGHLYRSTISVEYTMYPARQKDGKYEAARAGYKATDFQPFKEVVLEEKAVKVAAAS